MRTVINSLRTYIHQDTKAAPLAVFRILFGAVMLISTIRFWSNGWIEKLYLNPKFQFHYFGFEFVTVPGQWTYVLFAIMAICSITIMIGYQYRLSIILFFLVFTYVELMDKTTYLNHYYFVTVVSFMMIWLPMNCMFSMDAHINGGDITSVPQWTILSLQVFISLVYIYAGLAKLNHDWLMKAMPLTLWLPTHQDIPILGNLFQHKWSHYAFSWGGALYDLFVPFFLMWTKTRMLAFSAVLFFHIMTSILFPIGMFPYLMIAAVFIFFSGDFHERVIASAKKLICSLSGWNLTNRINRATLTLPRLSIWVVTMVLGLQLLIPLRGFAYPGNIFWTEQGYRFSWRVMLMEKTGYANFKVVDGLTGQFFYVQNDDFLTAFQEKEMSTQADFIIEYAHMLEAHFVSQGHQNIEIYVESYASLNGRRSQPFIDPTVDLTELKNSLWNKDYITPIRDE